VPLGTLIFRGLARPPIGVLLCLEFVVSGVLVTFLAEHVGGLPPAFIVLGTSSAVAAALAGQWLFAARLATPTAK
jgi:hypothetical protein